MPSTDATIAARRRRATSPTLALCVALALSGCATPVLESQVEVPARFAAADAAQEPSEAAWWESFGDPVLSQLMRRAAHENRDLRIAAERVRAARAGETMSRSALLPSISASASAGDSRTRYDDALKRDLPDVKRLSGGLDVSWEIDLAGRLRSGAMAASADTLAAEHAERGVRLLVLTDVATHYFTLGGALRQLETVRAISAAQDETLRLVSARHRAGLATRFDVERAMTDAARARAEIPPLETLAAVSRHRIAVLVGDQASQAATIVPWNGPLALPAARPGQPAALLRRRPDLLALEAQLRAANWRRQQAMAEWFPLLFVSALFGSQGLELNGLDVGSARYTNVAGLLAMPIFNAGRTRSINEIAESAQREALARYEDGIVRALEDVENALVAFREERRRAEQLRAAANSADAAFGRARALYERGQVDLLPLLDAQRARLAALLGANDSDTQVLLDSVRLYKALGGGWQAFEPAAAASHSPKHTQEAT